ncbi:MAG: flagellar M-ring protein FliF [Alphaproteobacteria bacterium]|nr:flagellar M-ring protein FliF [Alphaproteobacteria bacterium]
MGVVAVLMLGFFGFLILRATTPSLAPIYTGLTLDDSAAIVDELRSMNVAFELRGEGDTIMVPRDQITALRMTLAQDGLPTRGQVGYEIFDEQSTLGSTSFVQNINQVRALEGELARTIASLARIKSARVHLVLPERQLFRQETPSPSASIMLSVRGELNSSEIGAIQHLVSAAIEDLSPNRVSIVDDSGRLLASGSDGDGSALAASEVQERVAGIENRLAGRVQSILENVVGAGRARVQVAVELDLQRSQVTTETFDPDGQVVRSSQSRESSSLSSGGTNNAVSVSNELPNGTETSATEGSAGDQSTTAEETTNYEISKTTQTDVTDAGGIKRLSVAVAVDGVYQADTSGAATYTPRTQEELDQLSALVRSAVGFDSGRGDIVEVVNLQFAERPELGTLGSDEPGLFNFTRDDLINFANMGVTLLIALALLFFVLRPLLRRVLEPEAEPLTLPPQTIADTPRFDSESHLEPPRRPDWMDQAQQMGEAQMTTIKHVGEMIEEHPRQAATIVRDWLNQAA